MASLPESAAQHAKHDYEQWIDPEHVEYVSSLLTDDVIQRFHRVDWERANVLVALASLQRIQRLWRIIFGHAWFTVRGDGDEMVYQRLRASLLAQFDGKCEYDPLKQEALSALPDTLPTGDELLAFDAEWKNLYISASQRLEARLIQTALSQDVDPETRNVDALFVTYDDCLDQMEKWATSACDEKARMLGLVPEARKPGQASVNRAQKPTANQAQKRAANRKQQVRVLRDEGLTIKMIARSLKCSERTVYKDLDDLQ